MQLVGACCVLSVPALLKSKPHTLHTLHHMHAFVQVCLQENPVLFLQHDTKSMERVCALLSKMLSAGSCGYTLQCHIITALTCLLLELSVATRQQRLFEGFVEVRSRRQKHHVFQFTDKLLKFTLTHSRTTLQVLLEIMARCNNPWDAVLRSAACECLHELEQSYPGLFSQLTGNFLVFAQTEITFAFQSYLSLAMASLTHAVQHMRTAAITPSAKRQLLMPRPMLPFAIPSSKDPSSDGEELLTRSTSSNSATTLLPLLALGEPPRETAGPYTAALPDSAGKSWLCHSHCLWLHIITHSCVQ